VKGRELVALLGENAMRKLIEHCAGQRIYVSATPKAELAAQIGKKAARALSQALGGEYLSVATRLPVSDSQIVTLKRLGLTINQIAARTGRSHRSIKDRLHRARGV
jgi:DNA-directed RNA polymerase specialized sigma24 family protein